MDALKSTKEKPVEVNCVFKIEHDAIPQELKDIPRWVNWKFYIKKPISEPDKKSKVPLDAAGRWCEYTKPSCWQTYNNASLFAIANRGVGFVFDNDGIVGVDLDDCRDPSTGKLSDLASDILEQFDTYAEVSPSGTGIKLFVRTTLSGESNKKNDHKAGVEVYWAGRYFTLTGQRVSAHSEIRQNDAALQRVINLMSTLRPVQCEYDDAALARLALSAIPSTLADGYSSWLDIGMSLHSIDDSLLADWDAWSKRSGKYSEGVCSEKWQTFRGSGIGPGTLYQHAKDAGWSPPKGWNKRQRQSKVSKLPPATAEVKLLEPEERTDVAAAKRFADEHSKDCQYVSSWEKWLYWTGIRWKIDAANYTDLLAKQTAEKIWVESGKAMQTKEGATQVAHILKYAVRCSSVAGISSMKRLAECELHIGHDDLDTDPMLFNVQNGTVELETGKLRNPSQVDYLTQANDNLFFDPNADCPNWIRFLKSTFDNNQELIDFVRRLTGYFLTGLTKEQILPILYGSGSNGKSVFLSILQALLGEYATTINAETIMVTHSSNHLTELADFFGKRLAICEETDEGQRLNEARIKHLTGEGKIKARRMREDLWEFKPTHKLCIATNHKPTVRGTDHAIWRRLIIVPFNQCFEGETKDPHLKDKLLKELPGIFQWALNGLSQYLIVGLQIPEIVKLESKTYRDEQDTISNWIAEECVTSNSMGVRARASKLYKSYSEWCKNESTKPIGSRTFYSELKRKGYQNEISNGSWYAGIMLRMKLENESKNDSEGKGE